MKQIKWGSSEKMVPAVAMGCMRLTSLTVPETAAYLELCCRNLRIMTKEKNA